jgi:very-short-patch-repair endonuclease
MAHFTRAALAHFAAHHGVASSAELARCGLTDHDVRTLVSAGNLELVVRGAYRLPAVPLDELSRCAAVCGAHGVVISGVTAGRLWGFRRLPTDRRIHVIAPPGARRLSSRWVVPYRTAAIHARDVERRLDGIVVTSRPRTALDLARVLAPIDLLSVIEQAMLDGGHSQDEMRRVAVDWMSPRRPWLRRYLEILDRRTGGGAAESHDEVVVGDLLAAAGVVGLVRQFPIELPGVGSVRFDLAVPALRWAIEVDMFPTHRQTAGRRADRRRDEAAGTIGWLVERITPDHVGAARGSTIDRLVGSYHSRRAAFRLR